LTIILSDPLLEWEQCDNVDAIHRAYDELCTYRRVCRKFFYPDCTLPTHVH